MPLYFAYGSNMSRALMRQHCPLSAPVGCAELDQHRFIVTADGYASIVASPAHTVHGVLWQLDAGDVAALDAYEGVDVGLYRSEMVSVRHAAGTTQAMVYIGRNGQPGAPKPGYLELVLEAASDWNLPRAYTAALARWAPSPDGLRAFRRSGA
jgi:gamma-glutamylcyclotransferase (GGCT)/AIG2-like uncharacterized protein YtfP